MKKPLVILTGPTAVGKTALSIALAKKINGEIISADSIQVYKKMNIGSAKIKPEEMQGIRHYLIDEFEPEESFHVMIFQRLAKKYMQEIHEKGKIPILAGGTGFYIQAVLRDIDFAEEEGDLKYREQLEQLSREKGKEALHAMLEQADEKAAAQIHTNNVKRVIRALEFYKLTGKKISEHNEKEKKKGSPYCFSYFVLNDDRERLYQKIEQRIDTMLEDGLLEEVRGLRALGYTKELVSMQGLGYKELLSYIDGECTLEEAVAQLKKNTRHFAKRQLTWFRREQEVIWLNKQDFGYDEKKILGFMLEKLKQDGII